jgi:hypothetical protein
MVSTEDAFVRIAGATMNDNTVQAVNPSLPPGDVLAADRGLCSYGHLALLSQAGLHAVLRVGARQLVDFTPGRPFIMPGVRRTPAVQDIPPNGRP